MLAGIMLVGAVILVRNSHEDMGLLLDGDTVDATEGLEAIVKGAAAVEEPRWQIRQAI